VLPVQEVVLVKVSDSSSDLAGHPLQLQLLSVSEHPILLRHVAAQISLCEHTQAQQNIDQFKSDQNKHSTNTNSCSALSVEYSNIKQRNHVEVDPARCILHVSPQGGGKGSDSRPTSESASLSC